MVYCALAGRRRSPLENPAGLEKPYDLLIGLKKSYKSKGSIRAVLKALMGTGSKKQRVLSAAQPANRADASVLRTPAPLIGDVRCQKQKHSGDLFIKQFGLEYWRS